MKPNDISSNAHHQGSSIIHMLEHSLGEETLRAGLKKYLDKHKFNNAVTRSPWIFKFAFINFILKWQARILSMNYRKYLDENLSPHKQRNRDLWRALGVAANGRLDVEVSGYVYNFSE